jgi:hypothetical protein
MVIASLIYRLPSFQPPKWGGFPLYCIEAENSSSQISDPCHPSRTSTCCQTCVVPGRTDVERHLRAESHRLSGQALRTYVEYTSTLTLKSLQQVQEQKLKKRIQKLEHLEVYDRYQCLLCSTFLTIHQPRMRRHESVSVGRRVPGL